MVRFSRFREHLDEVMSPEPKSPASHLTPPRNPTSPSAPTVNTTPRTSTSTSTSLAKTTTSQTAKSSPTAQTSPSQPQSPAKLPKEWPLPPAKLPDPQPPLRTACNLLTPTQRAPIRYLALGERYFATDFTTNYATLAASQRRVCALAFGDPVLDNTASKDANRQFLEPVYTSHRALAALLEGEAAQKDLQVWDHVLRRVTAMMGQLDELEGAVDSLERMTCAEQARPVWWSGVGRLYGGGVEGRVEEVREEAMRAWCAQVGGVVPGFLGDGGGAGL